MASMGANTLVIFPAAASIAGVNLGVGTMMTMTPEDADTIRKECPAVGYVAPIVRARTQLVYGNRNYVPTYIYGTAPSFLQVREWTDLDEGEAFTEHEVRNASKVCLIGQTIVNELFGGQSPIGKEVRIRNVAFKVIGVLQKKGANVMGMDQDDILLAPWTTIKYRVVAASLAGANQSSTTTTTSTVNTLNQIYPNIQQNLYPVPSDAEVADFPKPIRFTTIDQILISARSGTLVPSAIQQITDLLRERHHLRGTNPNDFTIRDMTEVTKALSSTSELMTKLLLCVAMISLVVGGVGIMNIMLVSVTERTREIGLRMAVGAEPNDILRQFLTEAVVLCLLGGFAGILWGVVVPSWLIWYSIGPRPLRWELS
jgi:ABC-type antimicrobial peptide transport system permease subunit